VTSRERIAVVGATSWGRSLARLFAANGHEVLVWARDRAEAARLETDLGGLAGASSDVRAFAGAALIVYAVPSASLGWNLERTRAALLPVTPVLSAIKGIEVETARRMSEVLIAHGLEPAMVAVLSGPNLSKEIDAGMPAASVVASVEPGTAAFVQSLLHGPRFRVYTSSDVVGVELGGSLKNIAAIACGISDGLGFGTNARAGLMTRALAEMTRLGLACGARTETFFGLAGVGDLIATCESDLSRNRRLGIALAAGKTPDEAQAAVGGVAEGVPTAIAARRLARERGVEMPIAEEVYRVLNEAKNPRSSIADLMARAPRDEFRHV
jgi:glycerol-3-phosphate dehydrogenase (NAD(P)+)